MYHSTKASGARIRELRLAKKLDQIELAELLNVSHGYISRIESGKKGCSVDLLIQLSEIFDAYLSKPDNELPVTPMMEAFAAAYKKRRTKNGTRA